VRDRIRVPIQRQHTDAGATALQQRAGMTAAAEGAVRVHAGVPGIERVHQLIDQDRDMASRLMVHAGSTRRAGTTGPRPARPRTLPRASTHPTDHG
jgi:hypothetical protein